VAVIDDREEFANAGRFPTCRRIRRALRPGAGEAGCRDTDYFVVLTRGHTFDSQCVSLILRRGFFAYLGMIGSG
jgi:xanthine dehydrogenase accessory factor